LWKSSPLKPAELQVLRAQYEKEGDYVGIQTKFNFAWVWEHGTL
jgi:fission 1 protein